jgi:catechol 2,3-dioxygenase-like lactoylglutathione lyase family enzyme
MPGFGERARAAKRRQMTTSAILFQGYDHVGIRVSDAGRALDFYARLGFRIDPRFISQDVAEIVASDGTRINLIFNGAVRGNNVLLDEPVKRPGYRHGAFLVESLQSVLDWGRRLTCFVRDPDLASCATPMAMSSNSTSSSPTCRERQAP